MIGEGTAEALGLEPALDLSVLLLAAAAVAALFLPDNGRDESAGGRTQALLPEAVEEGRQGAALSANGVSPVP